MAHFEDAAKPEKIIQQNFEFFYGARVTGSQSLRKHIIGFIYVKY